MRQEGYSADAVIRIQYYIYKKPQDYFSPAAFATGFIGERQETYQLFLSEGERGNI